MKSRALLETEINSQYSKRFEKFGPTAKGVFWASTGRQERRFDLILKEIQKISRNHIFLEIADIGCGYGSFADYLNRNHNKSKFNYEGFDINPKFFPAFFFEFFSKIGKTIFFIVPGVTVLLIKII